VLCIKLTVVSLNKTCVQCCKFVTENGCKSVTPLLVAPVDVQNLHLGEFLTQHCHTSSVTGECLFSLTCQTPKTANIQGMMIVGVNIAYTDGSVA